MNDESKLSEVSTIPKSNMDIQKHLYDTGLQNIFNQYEKNVASLEQNKQKEIQDAYYVRELSKKYLGEYASNKDVGDVSGQVLDIYGQYQSNIGNINQNYDNLKLGVENAYGENKNKYDLSFAETQLKAKTEEDMLIENQKREENQGRIVNALTTGNIPQGMNEVDFIESEKGNLEPSQYWALKTQYQVALKTGAMNEVANSVSKYKTQEDWDKNIDKMVSNGILTSQEAESMKSFYEIDQMTNYSLMQEKEYDLTYFASDKAKKDGKAYKTKNGDSILIESNEMVTTDSSLFESLEEKYNGIGFGKPFGFQSKWYTKETIDGDEAFVELITVANPEKYESSYTITKDKEESYNFLNKELGDKSGVIKSDTGSIAYKKEDNGYVPYLDFKAFNVKEEKGDFIINGIDYHIAKNYKENGKGGIIDLKNKMKNGASSNKNPKSEAVTKKFLENYFFGDVDKFQKYVKDSRNWIGTNKIKSKDAMVVLYNGAYFTINDGEIWELKQKEKK